MIVIADTSGLVAAFNASDPEHLATRQALIGAALTVVSPLVLLEIEHIATRNVSRPAAFAINDWLLAQERTGRVAVAAIAASALRTARTVQNRYEDLRLDLTDAVSVVLAERYETDAVLTLDRRDFRAIRPLHGTPVFRLLPDDS